MRELRRVDVLLQLLVVIVAWHARDGQIVVGFGHQAAEQNAYRQEKRPRHGADAHAARDGALSSLTGCHWGGRGVLYYFGVHLGRHTRSEEWSEYWSGRVSHVGADLGFISQIYNVYSTDA